MSISNYDLSVTLTLGVAKGKMAKLSGNDCQPVTEFRARLTACASKYCKSIEGNLSINKVWKANFQ